MVSSEDTSLAMQNRMFEFNYNNETLNNEQKPLTRLASAKHLQPICLKSSSSISLVKEPYAQMYQNMVRHRVIQTATRDRIQAKVLLKAHRAPMQSDLRLPSAQE